MSFGVFTYIISYYDSFYVLNIMFPCNIFPWNYQNLMHSDTQIVPAVLKFWHNWIIVLNWFLFRYNTCIDKVQKVLLFNKFFMAQFTYVVWNNSSKDYTTSLIPHLWRVANQTRRVTHLATKQMGEGNKWHQNRIRVLKVRWFNEIHLFVSICYV